MTKKIERSLEELYQDDPERADAVVLGRKSGTDRRGFLEGAGLAALGGLVGANIPFGQNIGAGFIPAALAEEKAATPAPAPAATPPAPAAPKGPVYLDFPGKDKGLVVIGDKPLVAETPEHLLNDDTTPISKFYIRNNGTSPDAPSNPDAWKITIDGEVNNKLELALGDLKKKYRAQTLRMVLECGGNGRSFYTPRASGNQWTNGGAGCAEWTGVRLGDVLRTAGVKPSGIYTAHYGADKHLSGDEKRVTLSRGVRMPKAMDPNSMIVWAMNGQPLPNVHGGPVRLVIPGWAGSASHKWLNRIWIRDKEHDGPGMTGTSYRVAIKPMVPGDKADPKNFKILESMPVRSIITNPANGEKFAAGTKAINLRGASWAGDNTVQRVDISIDFGQTWRPAAMQPAKNKYDWQRWTATINPPSDGYYEVWCRATDNTGKLQPHVAPFWNPSGYGGNPFHRVAILVG
jgi:sulfite oxidase